jgi:hypothetical protein
LISTGAGITANTALAFNEPIRQESSVAFYRTVGLSGLSLFDISILPQTAENILDNLGLMRGGRAAEDVEFNVEPIVDTLVNSMVFCAELFRCYAFFEGFGLGGSSVFILHCH